MIEMTVAAAATKDWAFAAVVEPTVGEPTAVETAVAAGMLTARMDLSLQDWSG